MSEKVTIVVTPRDRFSTADKCLNNILKFTPEPYDLIVVLGGCPAPLLRDIQAKFGPRVRWILEPSFLNTAQARNKALREIRTRLAVFLDMDIFVRPGWFEPLVRCQTETGADMVGPMVLDRQNHIHTAGNNLFITHENGRAYATMEIRYANQVVGQDTNIRRQENDFLEIHCQLVVVETARQLGIYDENLREFHEMDSGLTLTGAGKKIMLEPASTVYFYYPDRLTDAEDVPLFCWKWDMKAIREGFAYFEKKWGYNLDRRGYSTRYFEHVNRRCNFFARRWPSPLSMKLDTWRHGLFRRLFRYWE